MKITEDMDLKELADRMGEATVPEVLRMRSILCDSEYFERDTAEIPEWAWQDFLDDAVSPQDD